MAVARVRNPLVMSDPWLILLAGALLPGLGLAVVGERAAALGAARRAASALAMFVLSLPLVLMTPWALPLLVAAAAWFVGEWTLSCLKGFRRAGGTWSRAWIAGSVRSPGAAVFLSFVVPGIGHIPARAWARAAFFFIAARWLSWHAARHGYGGELAGAVGGVVIRIAAMWDAWSTARRARGEGANPHDVFPADVLKRGALSVALRGALVFAIHSLTWHVIAEPVRLPTRSESMTPALQPGDLLIGSRPAAWRANLRRGDIVSFRAAGDPGRAQVKRVAGLPGETVRLAAGRLMIDGRVVENADFPKDRRYENSDRWRFGQEGQDMTVPARSYYMLGDNSAMSGDSRHWGFVPASAVRSRILFVAWPPRRWARVQPAS